jgi:ubiquinone biosynthesis protein COQ4
MESVKDLEQQWQDLAIESFLQIVKAPDGDFDAIARLTKALSDTKSLNIIVEFLSRHPQGKQAFLERPRLGNVALQQLYQLPQNTLGYIYADSMLKNGLAPLQASSVNNDREYLIAHITETHDLWHIVTGCNTNILGEIQLEAFYVAQLYASRFWLALLAKNLLKAVVYDVEASDRYMDAITQGWVMAKQAKPLFGIRWNTLWEKPLEDVRTSLNIIS